MAEQGTRPLRPRAWLPVALAAVGLALLLRVIVLDACRIDSPSMAGTLLPGDHLLIDKLVYGAPAPGFLPSFRFPGLRPPRRGEVVVALRDGRRIVKRCAAAPGDTLEERDGLLYVNRFPAVPGRDTPAEGFPAGRAVVPDDRYFLLGDNSGESYDSRHYGFVPGGALIGRALIIYWSRDADHGVRWSRIGRMVP